MTLALCIFVFALLMAVAGLYVSWARGGHWPVASEMALAAAVVGDPKLQRMPPPARLRLIALAHALGALSVLALGFDLPGPLQLLATYAGAGFCAAFGLRGLLGFLPFWRKHFTAEPFNTIDRIIFSPCYVLIAEAFFTLVSDRF